MTFDPKNHIGFPLPPEMFHPHTYCWALPKDEAMSELLQIPLKCYVCNKVIKRYEKSKREINPPFKGY